MTELVLKTSRLALEWTGFKNLAHPSRLLLIALIISLASLSPELRGIVFGAIADAYLAVTVFVAGTLALVYAFERGFGFDLGEKMAGAKRWQVPMAAFLGALPGCGGAIIVVTQYTKGLISFGSVVAVLIATMGDAAFLLLAREPATGAMVLSCGLVIGTIFGWIVDRIHGQQFMRPKRENRPGTAMVDYKRQQKRTLYDHSLRGASHLWLWLLGPAIILGLLLAFQVDTNSLFGFYGQYDPTLWIGVFGGFLCLLMWAFSNVDRAHIGQEEGDTQSGVPISSRIIRDTNFVTSWVVMGFILYELGTHFSGGGVELWLKTWAPIVPLIAILIGFIPGCGPQIVVTSLYLSGAIPMAALFANAIANDGDALFPALALAPKAAVLATLYSAVPAFMVGYGMYFLM